MTQGFPEFVVGGVLFAPFVPQAIVALVIFLLVRPLLRLVPMEKLFANPPLIGVCLYVILVAVIMVLS